MKTSNLSEIDSLLSAESTEMDGKYLTFWTDGQLFGIPIADVVQIVGMQHITAIPDYPDYAKGVIDLRGSIIPLIDMRLRMGKPEAEYGEHSCIIVTNIRGNGFGFIVDEVNEVAGIPEEQISPPPRMGTDTANRYLTGIARLESEDGSPEKIVLAIDTTKILGEDEYDTLAQSVYSTE